MRMLDYLKPLILHERTSLHLAPHLFPNTTSPAVSTPYYLPVRQLLLDVMESPLLPALKANHMKMTDRLNRHADQIMDQRERDKMVRMRNVHLSDVITWLSYYALDIGRFDLHEKLIGDMLNWRSPIRLMGSKLYVSKSGTTVSTSM